MSEGSGYKHFCLTIGTLSKIPMPLDLMFSLFCSPTDISSCRYFDDEWLIHLWVIVSILNSICCYMGSQCNALSDLVGLSYFDLLSANFVHMFWILWYLLRVLLGMPYSTAFEESRCDMHNIRRSVVQAS